MWSVRADLAGVTGMPDSDQPWCLEELILIMRIHSLLQPPKVSLPVLKQLLHKRLSQWGSPDIERAVRARHAVPQPCPNRAVRARHAVPQPCPN